MLTIPEVIYIQCDGILTPKAQCPMCGKWAYLSYTQFLGLDSIMCNTEWCTYDEHHDFSLEYKDYGNPN